MKGTLFRKREMAETASKVVFAMTVHFRKKIFIWFCGLFPPLFEKEVCCARGA